MNRSQIAAVLATALVACGCAEGRSVQSGPPEERVEAAIEEVVEVCRQESWTEAAHYFVYRGDDPSRKWQDTLDPSDDEDLRQAERGCEELLRDGFPEPDSAFELGEVNVEEESEGVWYAQEVTFPDDPDAGPIVVALLEVDGLMAIGDIDWYL